MLTDVLPGWTAETLGGLTLLAGAAGWGWLRWRRTPADAGVTPATGIAGVAEVVRPVRTHTCSGPAPLTATRCTCPAAAPRASG
jgi:hypothetical protein